MVYSTFIGEVVEDVVCRFGRGSALLVSAQSMSMWSDDMLWQRKVFHRDESNNNHNSNENNNNNNNNYYKNNKILIIKTEIYTK